MKEKHSSKTSKLTNSSPNSAAASIAEAREFAGKTIVNNPYFVASHLMERFLLQVQVGNNPESKGME